MSSTITATLLLTIFLAAAIPTHAQTEPPDKSVTNTLKLLRERPDDFRQRAETLRASIQRKRPYLNKLNDRLNKARSQPDEKLKAHQLSRFSYQIFLVSSRIAADEQKLQATTALIALIPQLENSQIIERIKQELAKSAAARRTTSERLLREAETYRASITEPTYKAQFEQLIKKIQTEQHTEGGAAR